MKKFILPLLVLLFVGSIMAVESEPSEVVGYVKYDCVAGLNYIALPMESGYTWASEFADTYVGSFDALSYWDNATQQWVGAIDLGYWEGDFAIEPGAVLMVNAIASLSAYSIGDMPAENASYSLLPGLNSLMIPLNKSSITMASILADTEIGYGSLDAISYWDNASQQWVGAIDLGYWEGDFATTIGMPLFVNSLITGVWPEGPRSFESGLSKSAKK